MHLRWRFILKLILSIWLVYHLFVISVVPNFSSFAKRYGGDWLAKYANLIMINARWDMFAPNPPASVYVEYTVRFPEHFKRRIIKKIIPHNKERLGWNPNQIREFYHILHAVGNPERIKSMLLSWLCRKYPEAQSVKVKVVRAELRSFDQVIFKGDSVETLLDERRVTYMRRACRSLEQLGELEHTTDLNESQLQE